MKFKLPKTFFGWSNIKWLIKELMYVYSSKKSFFSKKRLESGMAFLVGQVGMVFFLFQKYQELSMTDMLMWAGVEFAISGYMVNSIQKEKKRIANAETDECPVEEEG